MSYAMNKDNGLKTVILTFDDGPHPKWTPKILELLHDYDVKAVFFATGKNMQRHPFLVQKILDGGHIIGNHTWSHRMILPGFANLLEKQVLRTDNYVREQFGYSMKLFRPPWGLLSRKQSSILTDTFSYKILFWDVDSLDWAYPFARNLITRLWASTTNEPILLMHDGICFSPTRSRSHTIRMLKRILKTKGRSLDFKLPQIPVLG
jgi:peptidoglycan/xylan/chitin deacetylase (PgdA/CDA1 family)